MSSWKITIALVMLIISCASNDDASLSRNSSFVKKGQNNKDLIIFIHGLFGDSKTTWENSNGSYWPNLLANENRFKKYDIFTVSYSSPKISVSSTIEEIATRIGQEFVDLDLYEYKRISFICHSMGGLIAKRILISLNTKEKEETLRKVRSILFLSTPAQGARSAEYASWFSMNPQIDDLKPAVFNSYLQALENDWTNLMIERDRTSNKFPKAFVTYETQKTNGIRIVSRVYSNTRADMIPIAFDVDHINICKPQNQQDEIYVFATKRILETHEDIIHSCELTFDEKDKFRSRVLTKALIFGRNPLAQLEKDKEEFRELLSYMKKYPDCEEALAQEISLLNRMYGSSILLSGKSPNASPGIYLQDAFRYLKKSYLLHVSVWGKNYEKKAFEFLENANSDTAGISIKRYFHAVLVSAMIAQPQREIEASAEIMYERLKELVIQRGDETSPVEDLRFFYSFPENTNNAEKYLLALRTLIEGSGGGFDGPLILKNSAGTTIIRYELTNAYDVSYHLEWTVNKSTGEVEPSTKLTQDIHTLFFKGLSEGFEASSNPAKDELRPLLNKLDQEKIKSHETKSYQLIKDGIGIDGATVGQSNADEIILKFGNQYRLVNHNNYSFEMIYINSGVSFYYKYDDPQKIISSIHVFHPFEGRTTRGIILGKSKAREVLQEYGKVKWTTSASRNTWYLPYTGIEFHVEKDETPAWSIYFDTNYENKVITRISIK